MLGIEVDLRNEMRALRKQMWITKRGMQNAITRVGRYVQSEAINRAPISPKQEQLPGRKKGSTSISKKAPGGLERSIEFEKQKGGMQGAVFVAANSEAGQYAKKIHDERGTSWENLGPGSIAKDGRSPDKVGDKFIERAWDENEDGRIPQIAKDAMEKAQ